MYLHICKDIYIIITITGNDERTNNYKRQTNNNNNFTLVVIIIELFTIVNVMLVAINIYSSSSTYLRYHHDNT